MKNLLLLFAVVFSLSLKAQVPGTWMTFDEDTNEKTALIELTVQEDGTLDGKIIKLFRKSPDAVCDKCKGANKNKPLIGFTNVWGFTKKDSKNWKGGNIIDPNSGKTYSCKIKLMDQNTLKVRGYIGTPLLGKTRIWKRAE